MLSNILIIVKNRCTCISKLIKGFKIGDIGQTFAVIVKIIFCVFKLIFLAPISSFFEPFFKEEEEEREKLGRRKEGYKSQFSHWFCFFLLLFSFEQETDKQELQI